MLSVSWFTSKLVNYWLCIENLGQLEIFHFYVVLAECAAHVFKHRERTPGVVLGRLEPDSHLARFPGTVGVFGDVGVDDLPS